MPGKPAAHLGAAVSHPLPSVLTGGPTALTVFVGGLPAWRAMSPAGLAALQSAKQTADTAIQIAENAALLAAPTPGGPAARAAAELAKGIAAASMSSSITAAAAGADVHACLTPWPVPPHGAAVDIQGSPTVLCAGKRFARQGDQLLEAIGPPNLITGGCVTVLIGAAGIVGNVPAGQAACVAARSGRNPPAGTVYPPGHGLAGQPIPANTPGQSYNNCGVEVSRQIINQANGSNVGQEALLNQSMASGQANQVAGNPWASGATLPSQRVAILGANGVAAHQEAPTMGNMEAAVADGRGVSVDVWAGSMPNWAGQGLAPGTGGHNILVTGVEYDDNGNPVNVIINDTGVGQCSQSIPYGQFQSALMGGGNNHVVTNNPIW